MTEHEPVSERIDVRNRRLAPMYLQRADAAASQLLERSLAGERLPHGEIARVRDLRQLTLGSLGARNIDTTPNERVAFLRLTVAAALAGDRRREYHALTDSHAADCHERTLARGRTSRDPLEHAVAMVGAFAAGDAEAAREMAGRLMSAPAVARQAFRLAWEAFATHRDANDPTAVRAALSVLTREPSLSVPWAPSPELSEGQQWALLLAAAAPPLFDRMTSLATPHEPGSLRLGSRQQRPEQLYENLKYWWTRGDEYARRMVFKTADDDDADPVVWGPKLAFLREHAEVFSSRNLRAADVRNTICVVREAFTGGITDELTAWSWIRVVARAARATYASWDEYAAAVLLAERLACNDLTYIDQTIAYYAKQPSSPWRQVPWDIDPELL